MIVPKQPQVWRMLQYVGRPLLLMIAYDFIVVFAYKVPRLDVAGLTPRPRSGFMARPSASSSAFATTPRTPAGGKAGKLWGAIVNNSRSLGRQVTSTLHAVDPDDAEEVAELHLAQQQIVHYQIAYVHALRQHLRQLPPWEELERLLPPEGRR